MPKKSKPLLVSRRIYVALPYQPSPADLLELKSLRIARQRAAWMRQVDALRAAHVSWPEVGHQMGKAWNTLYALHRSWLKAGFEGLLFHFAPGRPARNPAAPSRKAPKVEILVSATVSPAPAKAGLLSLHVELDAKAIDSQQAARRPAPPRPLSGGLQAIPAPPIKIASLAKPIQQDCREAA